MRTRYKFMLVGMFVVIFLWAIGLLVGNLYSLLFDMYGRVLDYYLVRITIFLGFLFLGGIIGFSFGLDEERKE